MAPELRQIIDCYLSKFFLDIAVIDPELSRLDFERKNKGKSGLNLGIAAHLTRYSAD
jgi:hypothetical protein